MVGVVSSYTSGFLASEINCFINLLYIDALRGDDATGVCLVDKYNNVTVAKEATEAADFLREEEINNLVKEAQKDGIVFLGHNRKKTVGKNRDEDAHPFVIDDNTVFFHNGTLTTHKHLADTEVDSHALGIHLAKAKSDPKEIEELLKDVRGAFACVWYDREKKKLNFIRNKERPLYLAQTESGTWVYASELWMIFGASLRNNGKIKESNLLDEETLYTLDLNKHPYTLSKEKLDIKKVYPSYKVGPIGGKDMGGTKSGPPFLSKNRAKRVMRDLEDSYVTFWADEVFPTSTGIPVVIGEDDEFPEVVFKAYMDFSEDFIKQNIIGNIVHGDVGHCYYDSVSKKVICHLKNSAQFTPKSYSMIRKEPDETATSMH